MNGDWFDLESGGQVRVTIARRSITLSTYGPVTDPVLSPAEARRLAAELSYAADSVDPPKAPGGG